MGSALRDGALICDIECVSAYELLTDYQRGRLDILHEKACSRDSSITEDVEDTCALQPATGRIVSIALLNPVANNGRGAGEVIYDGDPHIGEPDENSIAWTTGSEKQMLQRFWRIVQGRQLVTFNGYSFDCPYLVARSIYCGVAPTQRIAPRCYERRCNLDLHEELRAFSRAVKTYNLAFTCELFGVPSPKSEMDGSMVGKYYRDGRIREIAEYNLQDDRATAGLLRKVLPFLPEWEK